MTKRKPWGSIFVLSIVFFSFQQLALATEVTSLKQSNHSVSKPHKISTVSFSESKISSNNSPDTSNPTLNIYNLVKNIENYNSSNVDNNTYKLLNAKTLIHKDDFLSTKLKDIDRPAKIKKIFKMQKLASYISESYEIPLNNAEQIVYTTFVEANKKNLEPMLVLSIIDVESTFKQYSKSKAGAVGLTQVMPKVHKTRIAKNNVDIWSIHGNIKVGTDILKDYVELADGNVKKALQMYNGSSRDKHFRYSTKVMNKMQSFVVASK